MARKRGKPSPVVVVEKELLASKAWLSLNGYATQVYGLFLLRRVFERVGRNGEYMNTNMREIFFPYREAKQKFGITQPRFTRAIDELVTKGFIDIVYHGNGTRGDPTIYGISERWKKFGQPDFQMITRTRVKKGFANRKEALLEP